MAELFEWLYQVVQQIIRTFGYPGVFLLMLLENLFPPIPSELVMPFAGFMVARGDLNGVGVIIAATLGAVSGAVLLYYFGKKLGQERVEAWIDRNGKYLLLSRRELDKSLDIFERHGRATIYFSRLIPAVRSLISIPAGLKEMPLPLFLVLTTLGSMTWNLVLAFAGYELGSNWQSVLEFLDAYEKFLWVIFGAALIFFVGRRLLKRVRGRQSAARTD